ncbi:SPFH domain-containing protein [Ideonella oryzae]|uniref:SPFH domain-containing protein n=1 Tax=Ideonella oryzae TaxID=2937441 RepID=A0ABT1BRE1_9BURK|nr:SPFH domain-containing protein [Ideonella oryzae]MCO5978750.1 SPFH domain-containing protein [Ideonella oryzae]
MFGIRFIKSQPTVHLMQFRGGRLVREGAGQSFYYYAPSSTLVAVPLASQDRAFMLELVTADFQSVTVQGQVTYRISDPQRIATMMDFAVAADGSYLSEDPRRLGERIALQVEVIIQQAVQGLGLKDALRASADIARAAARQLAAQAEVVSLGLEVLGVSIMAIKPTPDIARALEAEARESNLKSADDAVYLRRMSAVEKERAIRQNELDTDIAVEQKKRQIQEAKMDAKAVAMRRENELRTEQMDADVALETQRKAFVDEQAQNSRTLAQAEAHRVSAVMQALGGADPRIIQALAATGMQPGQLIAQAFGGIAERAGSIGQFNMSPELLQSLMGVTRAPQVSA